MRRAVSAHLGTNLIARDRHKFSLRREPGLGLGLVRRARGSAAQRFGEIGIWERDLHRHLRVETSCDGRSRRSDAAFARGETSERAERLPRGDGYQGVAERATSFVLLRRVNLHSRPRLFPRASLWGGLSHSFHPSWGSKSFASQRFTSVHPSGRPISHSTKAGRRSVFDVYAGSSSSKELSLPPLVRRLDLDARSS